MPEPFLTPQWRTALTTFLLGSVGSEGANAPSSLFYDPEDQRRQDIQNGWWVVKKYNCMGCHQLQVGQRSVVMDLPFYQTAEGRDLLPPRLSSEGARVDPAWLLRFLHDPSLSGEKTPEQQQQINALPAASPRVFASATPTAAITNGAQTRVSQRYRARPSQPCEAWAFEKAKSVEHSPSRARAIMPRKQTSKA